MDLAVPVPQPVSAHKLNAWTAASVTGAAILLVLALIFGSDAGVTWDEPYQVEYGERILRWFASGFRDTSVMSYENLFAYGGLFDVPAQLVTRVSPLGIYETRHILTALLGVLGVLVTGATAARIAGPRAGFFAGLFLALTPAWIGHSLFNPKDVPFGTAAIAATYTAVRIATGGLPPTRRDTIFAGLAIGAALAIRAGGMFLFVYPVVAAGCLLCIRVFEDSRRDVARIKKLVNATFARLTMVVVVAWPIMIALWPWALVSPLERPLVAMLAASRFPWNGTTLFAGTIYRVSDVPGSYLPTWFAITTPEFYAIVLLLGSVTWLLMRRPIDTRFAAGTLTVATSVAFPFVAALLRRPALYDGVRHFLFLLPSLAALAGISFSTFLSSTRLPWLGRVIGAVAVVIACSITARDIGSLHPYEYVHFNRSFGGLPAAAGSYDTDYWGASYREGLAWVIDHPELQSGRPINVASCDRFAQNRLEYYRRMWPGAADTLQIVSEYDEADVFIAVTRYDCHKVPGEILQTVSRQGVPLLYVIRTVRHQST